MNNFLKIIFLFTLVLTVFSCSKSDSSSEPLRDYAEQYTKDLANIETYMHTHYIEVVNNPGATDDQDVTFTLIPEGGTQTSIWDQTQYPIKTRMVKVRQNDIDVVYKIYFLELRQGSGATSKSPCNVDRVLTSYRGEYIFSSTETISGVDVTTIKSEEFEESINPQTYFNLTGVIRGWSEIFPQFKTGTYSGNPDGTTSFNDFGAGVMFVPSGLAYFSNSTGGIPSYSPLIFSFKLYEIQRADQDADGIPSYQEDLATSIVNNDGTVSITTGVPDGYVYVLPEGVANPDNTDDGTPILQPDGSYKNEEVPDFLDVDDDGDFYTTASEIKNPITGDAYPLADIPTCGGSGNGKKNYLDPSCHGN
ncbi:FKBP-type peptidylprolyl isomerase [Flavobacterium paronense]|uniref:FKBP-type peptidyl-prolyl cis-trans isomerase n=1 Tax=Flavobacterium paronense TaxID=1392775 RepID=A0ABV5GBY4_9FLAO|nr:FKBP-type peptidylprolyl isomerase [Flavobacterium paronense]MDN3677746.1 FKBP-type peptidylprolyl isomerase [Flavobacterium paronense]